MRNLLSGLVSGAGLVVLWAILTKPRSQRSGPPVARTALFGHDWLDYRCIKGWTDACNLYVHWP